MGQSVDGRTLKYQPLGEARLQGADLKQRHDVQLRGAHGRHILLHAAAQDLAPARFVPYWVMIRHQQRQDAVIWRQNGGAHVSGEGLERDASPFCRSSALRKPMLSEHLHLDCASLGRT